MSIDPSPTPEASPFSPSKYLHSRVIIGSVIGFLTIGGVALLVVPQLLLDHWLTNIEVDTASARLALGSATQAVLFSLGGIIALVGVALSLSRHRLELDTSQHDRLKEERRVAELEQQRRIDAERELRTRFTQAVALLSDPDKPTTRQAGVYALSALADDWTNHGRLDERQVCIDVICGYLRSSWDTTADNADDERRIRVGAFDLIRTHLLPETDRPSWDGAKFNIDGALIDFDVDLTEISVKASYFSFDRATISRGIYFSGATLSDSFVTFRGATFSGSQVGFIVVKFCGSTINFALANFCDSEVFFTASTFSGGAVTFGSATFSKTKFLFTEPTFSGGAVDFNDATFSDTEVLFVRATLSHGEITFNDASFSDTEVYINGQTFRNHPVVVPWN